MEKQIDRIKTIDSSNKKINLPPTNDLQLDMNLIFNNFNFNKEYLGRKKTEYLDAVINYIKSSVTIKILEKMLKLRQESCPEEFE